MVWTVIGSDVDGCCSSLHASQAVADTEMFILRKDWELRHQI